MSEPPLNVLVTGGAGFIGSHLVEDLVGRGWSVVVLDNFYSGRMENLNRLAGSSKIKIVNGDVREGKVVDEALRDIDVVVHMAAFVDVEGSVKIPFETHDINVTGTLNVLEAAVRHNVQKFVFASSAGVYGDGNPMPLLEECDLRPMSPYAASKVAGEFYCRMFGHCYGLSNVILRFFNVYGPRQGTNPYAGVITKFVRSGLRGGPLTVYGDGSQTRDFVNVKDVVEAVVKALGFKSSKSEVFNVCTGKSVSINALGRSVCKVLSKDLEVQHTEPRTGDILHSYGDPTKARKALRFRAHIGFEEGLRCFVESLGEAS